MKQRLLAFLDRIAWFDPDFDFLQFFQAFVLTVWFIGVVIFFAQATFDAADACRRDVYSYECVSDRSWSGMQGLNQRCYKDPYRAECARR